ncbi:uncharacterized protein BYT42DRAFT_553230 [Radiomyces spectabilis]|uniref:uncharacterized protein n=1 Tax=Radiomyces spectabilis TaxID=64574 RepID=UPI00221F43B8|nr:uncharacterized protein BYT42DRAFT_553230 [Radiomyces spectabilis]KAI8394068.1 hypothetical protein BYT42DRAFT_553230 [Radiomyces spectabilis]
MDWNEDNPPSMIVHVLCMLLTFFFLTLYASLITPLGDDLRVPRPLGRRCFFSSLFIQLPYSTPLIIFCVGAKIINSIFHQNPPHNLHPHPTHQYIKVHI